MIELRCRRHQHMQLDPEKLMVVVKCRWCTNEQRRPVHHTWPLSEIIRRHAAGEVVGTCAPSDPEFVHWVVQAA